MIPNTSDWQIGDILFVKQGKDGHYERVIQISPEILTIDMPTEQDAEISTQGLCEAPGITYQKITNHELAEVLTYFLPRRIAYAITNRYYGSDYNMSHATFEKAIHDTEYKGSQPRPSREEEKP